MHIPTFFRRVALPFAALFMITACAGGTAAGWTYAPLGPSANPSAAASAGASSGPAASGGTTLETTNDQPLAFSPNTFTVAAGATVTVNYTNNSNLQHNVHFFAGADQNAASLGASTVGTGPSNAQSVTFTAPSQPGTYFFWCDVHMTAMKGTFTVQ